MPNEILSIWEIHNDIKEALMQQDAEIITKIYNEICPQRVAYLGDSLWIKEVK